MLRDRQTHRSGTIPRLGPHSVSSCGNRILSTRKNCSRQNEKPSQFFLRISSLGYSPFTSIIATVSKIIRKGSLVLRLYQKSKIYRENGKRLTLQYFYYIIIIWSTQLNPRGGVRMGNRRLYEKRSFLVKEVIASTSEVWHLVGIFTEGSVRTQNPKEYRIRVEPDSRWYGIREISFHTDRVYECESIHRATRRHIYGSGKWYISPYRQPGSRWWNFAGTFKFVQFEVVCTE